MKIDEAIELLNIDLKYTSNLKGTDLTAAQKLGIEALGRIQENRKGTFSIPLPSED